MFNPLNVSSKFAICGLPIRLDTYKSCGFNCNYCFSQNRVIGSIQNDDCNVSWLAKKFHKVYDEKEVNPTDFLECLLSDKISLHGGAERLFPTL